MLLSRGLVLKASCRQRRLNCSLMNRVGLSQTNYQRTLSRNKSFGGDKGSFVEIRDESISSSRIPLRISEEIREAIWNNGKAVVALESAIITHGMPYPDNIQTALHLENIIRQQGAIPATVGVIKGQLTVGLTDQEIESLGSSANTTSKSPTTLKVSRRDLPYVLAHKLNGGTTVSGTIIGAVKANIPIFVTGGLGGVHRGVETTFDISADLRELGRSPITVVSAGVKSILDIGKTLEYLETEGVCVCVLRKDDDEEEDEGRRRREAEKEVPGANMNRIKFPSFFTAESPHPAPYALHNQAEAANLLHSAFHFGLGSGILIAVPIPKEFAASGERIEEAIETALRAAEAAKITGKDMTPFLLAKVSELTRGESLVANKHLIENNARIGAEIGVKLAALRRARSGGDGGGPSNNGSTQGQTDSGERRNDRTGKTNVSDFFFDGAAKCDQSIQKQSHHHRTAGVFKPQCTQAETITRDHHSFSSTTTGRPVVIGGTSLDMVLSVEEEEIVSDGRTHQAKITTVPGGVGRNMAEALWKLGQNPLFISAIGDDLFGREVVRNFPLNPMDNKGISMSSKGSPTAIYSALLNHEGECLFGLGDMSIHGEILPRNLEHHIDTIRQASLVLLDGNIPVETMTKAFQLSCHFSIPVWFEPTEIRKAKKILQVASSCWSALRYISPNLRELISISDEKLLLVPEMEQQLNAELMQWEGGLEIQTGEKNRTAITSPLAHLLSQSFGKFPSLEIILLTRGARGFSVIRREGETLRSSHFPPPPIPRDKLKSVSGAGDCLNAGFITGLLSGLSLEDCAHLGTHCANKSLETNLNVPPSFDLLPGTLKKGIVTCTAEVEET